MRLQPRSTFSCTSTHTSCYAAARYLALPHIRHATLLNVLLHFHICVMLRSWTFSCISKHTPCYAGRSLALPHMRHATLLDVLLHFQTYVMLRCWTFSCTSTYASCYAGRSLALPHISHATLLDVLLHFRHIRHAMLLDVLLHLHTYVMLRCWTFSCTSTTSSDNFVLEAKKRTFPRSSQDTKLQFLFGETLDFPIVKRLEF